MNEDTVALAALFDDGDDTEWEEAFEEYVDGVGYTTLNRLAALYGGPGVR